MSFLKLWNFLIKFFDFSLFCSRNGNFSKNKRFFVFKQIWWYIIAITIIYSLLFSFIIILLLHQYLFYYYYLVLLMLCMSSFLLDVTFLAPCKSVVMVFLLYHFGIFDDQHISILLSFLWTFIICFPSALISWVSKNFDRLSSIVNSVFL